MCSCQLYTRGVEEVKLRVIEYIERVIYTLYQFAFFFFVFGVSCIGERHVQRFIAHDSF